MATTWSIACVLLASVAIAAGLSGNALVAGPFAGLAYLAYQAADAAFTANLHRWVAANRHRYEKTAE